MSETSIYKRLPANLPTHSIVFDEEKLPFRTDAFDVVLSSLRFEFTISDCSLVLNLMCFFLSSYSLFSLKSIW